MSAVYAARARAGSWGGVPNSRSSVIDRSSWIPPVSRTSWRSKVPSASACSSCGAEHELVVHLGHPDLVGVARQHPVIVGRARRPAGGGQPLEQPLALLHRQAQRDAQVLQARHLALLMRLVQQAQQLHRVDELVARQAAALTPPARR